MSHSITVGVKGAGADIEALRQLLDNAVNGESSSEKINDFFGEIGISKNPLKKDEAEFSISEEDSENFVEIGNPDSFYRALAKAFPALGFFCFSAVDDDNGNGVEHRVYEGGALAEEQNEFYAGADCGGYSLTHIPADACYKWIEAKYALWRIEDCGDEEAIAEARKAVTEAQGKYDDIYNFLIDGGITRLDTDAGVLRPTSRGDVDILYLLEEAGGYMGCSITEIETIDFSDEDYSEGWDELPDLSGFTGLKTLILSGTRIPKIPEYLAERERAGTLNVIR
ncbi:MAG: hypothetical protein LBB61_07620 [Treponema sp.]|jgi:hypothetical protein|nr:hypothetical protein [Treponema sp.]